MKYITKEIKLVDLESFRTDVDMLGIRQRDLASAVGVSAATVCRWVKGSEDIPERYFDALEKYIETRREIVLRYINKVD